MNRWAAMRIKEKKVENNTGAAVDTQRKEAHMKEGAEAEAEVEAHMKIATESEACIEKGVEQDEGEI